MALAITSATAMPTHKTFMFVSRRGVQRWTTPHTCLPQAAARYLSAPFRHAPPDPAPLHLFPRLEKCGGRLQYQVLFLPV